MAKFNIEESYVKPVLLDEDVEQAKRIEKTVESIKKQSIRLQALDEFAEFLAEMESESGNKEEEAE